MQSTQYSLLSDECEFSVEVWVHDIHIRSDQFDLKIRMGIYRRKWPKIRMSLRSRTSRTRLLGKGTRTWLVLFTSFFVNKVIFIVTYSRFTPYAACCRFVSGLENVIHQWGLDRTEDIYSYVRLLLML